MRPSSGTVGVTRHITKALLTFAALLAAAPPAEASICGRTTEVQNAIIAKVSGKSDCATITTTDLAGITDSLIIVDNSALTSLKADDFDGLTGLTRLRLQNNSLSSLPAGVFDELTSLENIWLWGNSLSSLPAGVFDELTSLEAIWLGGNSLSSLPTGVFDKLTSLTVLRLQNNSLSSLPTGVFDKLTALTELRLQGNSLSSLPAGVFDKLTALTTMWLNNNSLSSLRTDVFDKLTALTTMWLSGNSLSSLPAGVLDKPTGLTKLFLNDNSLGSLPAGVFDKLTGLTTLSLDDNSSLACLPFIPSSVTTLELDKARSTYSACGAGVTVGAAGVGVEAGATGTYSVVLDAYPTGDVTVTPASGAAGTATVSGALTFTQSNYATAQSVTVSGVAAGSATVSHTVSGGGYGSAAAADVAVTVSSLTAGSVEAATATLTLAGHAGAWWLKRTTPADTTCKSKGTTKTEDLTSLNGNTSYTYKAYSDSTCSTELASETFLTKPGKPTTPAAAVGAGTGKLAITSSVTGSGTLTRWEYKQKEGTGNFDANWTTISSTSTSLSHTVSGLTDGTDYQFKVRAVNATGNGAESDASAAVQPKAVALAAGSVEATTATLTISNHAGSWHYKANAAPDASCSSGAVTGTTKDLTGLSPNTSYTYKAYGDSSCSTEVAAASAFLTKPGKPTTPAAAVGAGTGKLAITSSVTGSGTLARWEYKQKEGTGNFDADWTTISSTSTSLSHTVSGLTDGTNYQFKVRAVNATGNGAESDASAAVQPKAVALAAGSVEATTATLTISNHAGSWHYKANAAPDASCSSGAVTGTTKDLTGLSPNTSYTYKAYGDSSCSTEVAAASAFLTKPGKPTTPAAAVGAGTGKLAITSSVTGSGTLTRWEYKQKEGTGNFDADWTTISSTSTSLSHTVSGLTDGTNYQFKVRAVNATGNGAESDASAAVQPKAVALAAGSVEATTATLTISNHAGSWHYKANAAPDASCSSGAVTGTTKDLTGLSPNTSYTYKAYGDSSCSTEVAAASAFLTKPGKPTTPAAAVGAGTGKLTITSSVTGSGTLTRWEYKQKEGTGNFDADWTTISSTSTSLSHTVSGLTDGTNYQFKVRAVNATGNGAESDASAAVQPKAVALAAGSVEATTATLTISNHAGSWHYKANAAPDASCSSTAVSGATEDLTGLSPNTSYTYRAYGDSSCSTEVAAASAFLTKPGKPTTPAAAVGAGTGKLTITSSVTGGGTLTRWEYKQKEGTGNFDSDWTTISSTSTSLSHTVSGLTDGTNYQFKVRAVNATGNGAESDASAAVQPKAVALAAGSVEATTATLTISNHAGSWHYKANAAPDASCSSGAVTGTTEDLTGLSSNTSYTYRAYGDSSCSTEVAAASAFLTKPGKPTTPAAAVGAGTGKLTITSSVTGSGTLTRWEYKQKEGTGNFDANWTTISSTSTSLSHTVSGLTDGTNYQFKVRAVNATGNGAESDASAAVQPKAVTLAAGSIEAATATLTIANHAGDWHYKANAAPDASCSSTAVSGTTKDLTGLSPNTSYTYKAYGDSSCSTEVAAASAFLTKPGKPTTPTAAVGAGTGKLTITSSVAGSGTLTKWEYKRKEGTGDFDADWTAISSTSTSLSHTVSGLTDGTNYQFKVRAVNATGNGAESDASAAVQPKAVTLAAGSVEATTATLTISNHAGDWHYKANAAPDASCSSGAVTGTTEDLTGLSSNTSYTYKAYGDSSCNTEVAAASAFLTKPGKPTTPAAAVGAGTGKLTITSSVTGSGTLTRWEYKQKEGTGNFDANWTTISSTSTSLSHTVSGLTDGTNYQFKVRAVNATGNGAESDASAAVQPKAVTLAAGSIEAATATLTIANHAGDWHYKANAAPDASCSSTAVSGTTKDLTGLSSNTSYTYKAYGDSSCSTEVAAASAFLTKPGKPTTPAAAVGAGTGKLTITSSVTGSGTLTRWEYKQKEGTGNFDADWTTISSTSTSLSHTVSGLTDGTNYQFKVRAVNATGNGAESDASTAVQPKAVALAAGSVEATTATLTIANHAGDWHYKANAAPDASCSSSAVTGTTEDLTGLSPNTSYTYKAYGDSSCSTEVAAASAFLTKPGKPTTPAAAVGAGTGKLAITSSVTGSGTLTRWEYKQKEGTGNFDANWTTISSTSTSLSHTVSGLTDGTDYQFKVRAVNATGNGAESDASAAVQPKAVALAAGSVEATTATLTISNHAGSWHYKANAAPDASCSSGAVTGTTKDLTGLSPNTSYTYKAYGDSSCSTEVAAASAFLTKPGKPTTPAAAVGAGTGKLAITSSVTGSGTLARWEYKQKEGTGNFDADWTTISSTSTSLSHTVSGLTDGTNYQFKVRAVNATGNGAESDASAAVQPKAVALAAGSVEATTATLTISNHAGSWHYKANAAPDASCSSGAVTGTTKDLTGLSPNTSYTYKAYGDSSCSTEVAAASAFLTKPGKPTTPAAAVGAGTGKLAITSSVTGSGTLTRWEYKQKEGTGNFDADWTTISSTSTSLSHTVSGLTDGTNYQFKVRAVNATGNGAESDASAAVQPKAVALAAGSVEATTATLTISNHAGSWHYKANAAPDASCSSGAVTGTTKDLTGLSPNTSYTYKAYGDSSCSTEVAAASAFLTKPGKPTTPAAAVGAGTGKLTITSSVTGSGTLTRWEYKQKEGTGNFDADWTTISSTSTSLSHTVSGLTDGTNYQFKVRAVNATGNGAESDASAAVQPKAVALAAGSVEATTATLTISNHAGSWHYKANAAPDASCSSTAVSGATEDLTGLSPNTSYTYRAYGDSSCSTEVAAASAFLTKPGKPTTPAAAVGAGTGKLTITSSVTGGGTLTRWEYKQKEGTGNFDSDWTTISSTSTSLSHTVSGLTDGTNYQFKVRAVNATGNGAESDASAAVQPKAVALAAGSVEATTATLTISNHAGSWHYKANAAPDASCSSGAVTGTTEDLTGLSSNTSYTYRAYGDSSCSTEVAAASAFLTKPGKPTTPAAAVGAGTGKLTITSSVTGSGTLTRWEYKQKEGTGNFDANWTTISSTSTSLSHTVSGLTDGTNYQFKVRAVNATGNGAESDASAAVQPKAVTLAAGSIEAATATLTIANHAGDWHYKANAAPDASCSSTAVSGTTKDLTGLSPNTSYTYKAYGDSSCSTEVAAASAFLTKPGKPTTPTAAVGAGTGKLTITSSVAGSGTLTKWEYKRKEGTGDFDADWTAISSTSTSLSHTVSGLTDGTNYQFKVRAVNATGNGAESDASAAVQPKAVTLAAGSVEATTATLTISNHAGDWHYKANAAPDASCSSGAVTGTTEDLTGLSSNTSYTYKAYGDSSCNTEVAAASAFLTKPGKPTTPAAAVGAGTGKLTITSSVTGSGTLTRWEYKQKEGTGNFDANWTTISSTSTSLSHTVSGLTDGTNYQFKVRAVNATGNGAESDASAAVQPKAVTLAAGSIEAATATLTIANHAGDWHYKANAAPDASCSSTAVSGTTKDLTGLSSNTSYTYKAYGDSSCSTEVAAASAFLTKPGKPTTPAAAVGAGTGKLTITSSVTGSGTLTRWEYKQKEGTGNFDANWTTISSTSTSLSHTVSGLTDGTNYQFKVRAVNATGNGAESDASTAVQPKAVALAAGSVEATTATLTIANHAGDWHYKANAAPDASCSSSAVTGTTEDLTGLSPNTSYTYKAYGDSSCSTEVAAASAFLTKPGKPTTPAAAVGAGTGKLAITSSVTGSGTLTRWEYKQKEGTGNFDADWTTISSTSTSLSHTVSGLTDGTNYQFKVRAVNATGNGAESDASAAVQPKAVALAAGSVEATTATLTIANHAGDWHYKANAAPDASCSSSAVTGTTEDLTGLSPNTSYTYKAYGDSSCNTEVAAASAFLTKPGKPTTPAAAVGAGTGKLAITSSVTGSGTLTRWEYKQKEGTGNFDADWTTISSTSTSLSHTVSGLTDGTNYQFKVRAVNATGNGAESDASAAVQPAARGLAASSVEAATATLTISNHAGSWHYKANAAPDASCSSSAVTGATEDLTGLSSNTSYTYRAYGDSSCSTEVAAASAFLTKPGKPTTPAAAVGAGTGKLTITSSVTGGGTLARWEYKQKEGTGNFDADWTTISSTSTSLSHTVSGLTDGTNYQFKVRAVNATGNGAESDASAAVQPKAVALAAGSVEATTATLTISNHAGSWYYKANAAPDASCSSTAVSGATEDLTGLSPNTSYTYKAYGDSSCSTEVAAASAFLTKPGKPTTPAAAVGAGTGKLAITSSVTGSGTLTRWEYKQKEGTGNFDANWTTISSTSTSLSHTVSGLTDGTDYQFKVRAVNATGNGAESDASAAVQPKAVALAAGSVEATTATLTISNHAGSWYYKANAAPDASCSSGAVTGTTKDLTGLSPNTSYTYKAYGDSSCSTEVAAASAFLTKPGKPTTPAAAVGAGTGKLAITSSVTGSGTLARWEYKQKEGTGNFDADWTTISSTSTSLSHTVSGLTDGTNYQFKVRAVNATGNGAESDASAAVQPKAVALAAGSVEATTATLTISNHAGSWHYKANAAPDASCSSGAVTGTTKDLTGLSPNTSYTYKAYGDSSCSTEVAAASAFLTKPGKPTTPAAAVGAGTGKLAITSSVTGSGTLTRWEYKQKEGTGNFDADWTTISSTSTSLSHTVSGLTDGTNYQFKVRAVNATGNGAESDASAAVQPKAVALAAGSVEATTATLTISNHAGSWHYKANAAPDASCSSGAVTGTTKDLTGLSPNTSYTYKAYGDSSCSTEVAAASAFLTKPGKPTTPAAAVGAGTGKLTITSSVTGSGTLTRWEYKQKEGTGNFDADWTTISSTSTSLSHTVSGLTDGTNYQFKVRAVNATGNGAESDASAAVQPKAVALAAGSVEATTATLTISNHAGSWYYKANAAPDASCSSTAVSGATEDLTGLSPNTSYTYRAYGDSSCSTEVAAASAFLTKPGKPTTPAAAVGAGTGKLTITSSVTGGGTLTRWEYKQKEGTGNFDSDWTTISSTSTSLSHTVSGLTDGTNYQFKVRAVNATGNGAESDASAAVQPKAVTLAAGSIEAATATLTIANHAGDWHYKANAAPDASCSSTAVSGTTKDLTGLSPNTSYTYKAYGDSSCNTEVAAASAFLTKPGKPTTPAAAVGAGTGKLTITSSVTGSGTLSRWEYKRKEGTGDFDANWTTISSTSTSLSHTVSGLTDGTDYQFKVRAVNATGNGAESDASTAVQPKAVTLTAGSVEATTATLTISNHAGSWHYKANAAPDASCSSGAVTGTTEDLTGLSSNTSYTYRAYGDSSCSTEVAAASAFLTKPGKPTTPTAAVGAGTGKLTITSSVTGGGTLTRWEYKQKEGTGNFDSDWTTISSTSTSLSHTVSGLTDGTDYRFKVRAVNATGNGAESDASAAVQPKAVALAAGSVEATTATLTISNHAGSWHYKANAAPDASCSSGAVTGTTKDLTGLSPNTSYTYKAYGDSSCSTEVAAASAFLTKPGKPTTPTATSGVGGGKLTVSSSVTGSGTLTRWEYKKKKGTGHYDSNWTAASSTSTTLSHTVSGLDDSGDYRFKVRAVNATGNGAESDASAAARPNAVTLSAGSVGETTATLTIGNWIRAWWHRGGRSGGACAPVAAGTAEAALSGLEPGTAHVYGAYSKSGCAAADLIATASFTTLALPEPEPAAAAPGAPSKPEAVPGHESAALSWTPGGDGGSPVTGWQYLRRAGDNPWGTVWTDLAALPAGNAASVAGLAPGVPYRFRVRAVNAVGAGAASPASDPVAPLDLRPSAGSPPDIVLPLDGGPMRIDPAGIFDGAGLTYGVRSADAAVAGAAVADGALVLTPRGLGRTAVAVTAVNEYGSAEAELSVEVRDAPPAVAAPLPDIAATLGRPVPSADLKGAFDGTSLRYAAAVSPPGVAEAAVEGAALALRPLAPGEAEITVTASNGAGEASQTFALTVRDAPPEAVGSIPALTLKAGGEAARVELSGAFAGTGLAYAAASPEPGVAAVSVAGSVLTVSPLAPGRVEIEVAASNGAGRAGQRVPVAVVLSDAETRALGNVLAGLGRARLNGAATLIASRFAPERDECARLRLLGRELPLHKATPNGTGRGAENGGAEAAPGPCARQPASPAPLGGFGGTRPDAPATLPFRGGEVFGFGRGATVPARPGGAAPGAQVSGPVGHGASAGVGAHGGGARSATDTDIGFADRMLAGLSFDIPLGRPGAGQDGAGTGGGGLFRNLSLYGGGDTTAFDGGAGTEGAFDGQVRSFSIGIDGDMGERWRAGLAVTRSTADGEYVFAAPVYGAGGRGEGALETSLVTVLPYAGYDAGGGRLVWAALGAGRGDLRLRRRIDGAGAARSEGGGLSLAMGLVGGRWRLAARGLGSLAAVGDAGFVRLAADGGVAAADALAADASRLRLGIEFSADFEFAAGTLTPFGEISARRDGGDGVTGAGVEMAGGARFLGASGRVALEARARVLALHAEGGHREVGYSLTASVRPRQDGGGFTLSLSPAYGNTAGGALLRAAGAPPQAFGGIPSGTGAAPAMSVAARVGYGLPPGPEGMLLSPFAEFDSQGGGTGTVRGGLVFGIERPRLRLRAELSSGAGPTAAASGFAALLALDCPIDLLFSRRPLR